MDRKKPGRGVDNRDFKPRYSSNSDIFSRRGDPWVSDKEGQKLFGRNAMTEDPERDQYVAAERMSEKRQRLDADRLFSRIASDLTSGKVIKPVVKDEKREKLDSIVHKMRLKLIEHREKKK